MNTIYEYYLWNRVCAEGVGKGQRTGVGGLILMTCINIQHIYCYRIKDFLCHYSFFSLFNDEPDHMQTWCLILRWPFSPWASCLISDCPKFLYGPNCDRCQCNQERSLDCDKTTGICQCKTGFSGDSCACVVGRHFCDNSYSFCGDPTPTCYCKGQNVRLGFNCTGNTEKATFLTRSTGFKCIEVPMFGKWS